MNKQSHKHLVENFKELRLITMSQEYEVLADQARKDGLSYEQYLFELIQLEYNNRCSRRQERWLRESRLPLDKNLDNFNLKRLPMKIQQQFQILREGLFLDHNENILVFGNPGSGKTHLTCALGHELIRHNRRIYFSTCALLLQELLTAKRDLKLRQLIKRFNKYQAIIIDDIGYVGQDKNREEVEVLFTLLAERYESGSVMITSNLPFSQWERVFKDPIMTTAAIDRIVHHSVILELNLPSYRMDAAKKRIIKRKP